MKKVMLATLAVLISGAAVAQNLPSPDAKTLAMGGVEMTTFAGSHTIYNNMAMAAFGTQSFQLSSSYNRWEGIDYYTVTGSKRIGTHNTLQAGWRNYRYTADHRDMSFDLGYARNLNDNLALGVTGHYLNLKRPTATDHALSFDISMALRGDVNVGEYGQWRVGARIEGLGGYFDSNAGSTLPLSLTAGAALDTYLSDAHQITVAADCGYNFKPSAVKGLHASLGAEYNLMQLFQLRAGYHLTENMPYTSNYGSVGCGVRFMHLRLDFAYLIAKKSSPLHNMYSLSFGLDF